MTTNQINVAFQLESARHSISIMESLIHSCHLKFEWVFPTVVYRWHEPSSWLPEAHARVLCAQNYVAAIDASDSSKANQNRAERANLVCVALEGSVRALLSRAYLELAQKNPQYKKFGGLGEQALALSQVTLAGNWEYEIPKLLIWEDQELPHKQRCEANRLLNLGDAALSYALALIAQLRVLEKIAKPDPLKIERVEGDDYQFGEDKKVDAYVLPRVPAAFENRERYKTREEVNMFWGSSVYEDAREACWYRQGGKWTHDNDYGQPKDRLIGFKRRRGGTSSRKRRAVRRAESKATTAV